MLASTEHRNANTGRNGAYLVRYGAMGRVGRFTCENPSLERQQAVVVRTHRGSELGVILTHDSPSADPEHAPAAGLVLRTATQADLDSADFAQRNRQALYQECASLVLARGWPIVLLDLEPVLDPPRLVLYYLHAQHFEIERQPKLRFQDRDYELYFDSLAPYPEAEPEPAPSGCGSRGSCGSCASSTSGCGAGGSCGSCASSTSGCGAR